MPESTEYSFSYQEVAEMLIRKAGLKKGHWQLSFRFGLHATNIGPSDNELRPAAIIGVVNIGLAKAEKPTNLSVDAAALDHGGIARKKATAKPRKRQGPGRGQEG